MAAKAKGIADSAQAELDLALPALDAALSSLKNLTRNDIVEVKSLRNPPQGVKTVMEACCIMFQIPPKMVADPNKVHKHSKKICPLLRSNLFVYVCDKNTFIQRWLSDGS